MKIKITLLLIMVTAMFIGGCGEEQRTCQKSDNSYFKPNWESLTKHANPEWLKDAKYGIFIHFGIMTVPACNDEWYARWMYVEGHPSFKDHLDTYGPQKDFGYIDFIPDFKAEYFDADEWVSLFKDNGAKFVVPVAEHHDHFAMWDSDLTQWDAAEKGPKTDIVGEIAKAAKKQDFYFGVSDHRARGRTFYTYKEEFDTVDPEHASFYTPQYAVDPSPEMLKEWMDDWYARKIELIDKYQPLMLWFDYGWAEHMYEPYKRKMMAYYYNKGLEWDKEVVVTYKGNQLPMGSALLDIERGKLEKPAPQLWQTDTSVARNTWCYTPNMDLKPANELVDDLIDIVSKNGVLLLNIGPKSDGTIPENQRYLLREIGKWLKINGDSIYYTRPWQDAEEGDIRFTRNGNKLYAILLDWPGGKDVTIKSLGMSQLGGLQIADVKLIGAENDVQWKSDKDALKVSLPVKAPCMYAQVIECTLQGRGVGYVDVKMEHVKEGYSVTASGKVMNFTDEPYPANIRLFNGNNVLGQSSHTTVDPMSEQTIYYDSNMMTITYSAAARIMPYNDNTVLKFALGEKHPVSQVQVKAFKPVDLLKGWKFKAGDNPEWAKVEVDHSDWKTPRVPGEWPAGRIKDATGWYRNTVKIPSSWKGENIKVDFGIILDECVVYFNGKKLGQHSNIKLEFHTSSTSAKFDLPDDMINFNGENTIAIRVYSKGGKAGLIGPPGSIYID